MNCRQMNFNDDWAPIDPVNPRKNTVSNLLLEIKNHAINIFHKYSNFYGFLKFVF